MLSVKKREQICRSFASEEGLKGMIMGTLRSLAVVGLLMLTGCFSAYQSPRVLGPGERSLGVGVSFGIENLKTPTEKSILETPTEKSTRHYYLLDSSIFYRRNLASGIDGGIRVSWIPGISGTVFGDVRYQQQLGKEPLPMAVTYGLVCWTGSDNNNGADPYMMIMFGGERLYGTIYLGYKAYSVSNPHSRGRIACGSSFALFRNRLRVNPEVSYYGGNEILDFKPWYVTFGLGIQYCFPIRYSELFPKVNRGG